MLKIFIKPIFTGFAPNLTAQAIKTASSFLFLPWCWPNLRRGDSVGKVEEWLKNYFQTKYSFVFDSGRSALFFALKALGVGEGDEVLVQSFTCVVVINAIKWTGAKPIYIDIKNDFNMAPNDLSKKITQKAKVLIIQHTFGCSADLDNLIKIAKENNLKIIEDCAHAFGAEYNNQLLGTFGDIGMFSFGSDKVVSCVRGGGLITNNDVMAGVLVEYQKNLPLSPKTKVIQHLFHYIFFAIGKPLYNLGVGKWLLALVKKLNIINQIVYKEEKIGLPVLFYPAQFPNALAKILLEQFVLLNQVILHQQTIVKYYQQNINNQLITKPEFDNESIWLRYTVLLNNPNKLLQTAKKQGIILGNWYNIPVAAAEMDLGVIDYVIGSCPNDEKISKQCLNLPTDRHISIKDARRIVKLINNFNCHCEETDSHRLTKQSFKLN